MENTKCFNTLFLDRDGVINRHRPADYVKSIDEMDFLPGSLEALKLLSPLFRYIFVVTNQRGVGKGVMTAQALEEIHAYLQREVTAQGAHIDHVYSCTDIDKSSFNRKPNPGMALQAKQDYPEVDFLKSIMAGDSASDLLFARNTGMYSIFINTRVEKETINPGLYDEQYPDLYTFATNYIKNLHS